MVCANIIVINFRYLGTLRVDRSDLTYIWGGIQYLAVEMVDFLRVQAIINRIKADKENIRDVAYQHIPFIAKKLITLE